MRCEMLMEAPQGDWLEVLKEVLTFPSPPISFLAGLGPSWALGWTGSRVCCQGILFLILATPYSHGANDRETWVMAPLIPV